MRSLGIENGAEQARARNEVIEEPTMTSEELRIHKSEDFLDLEEGKNVSWSVEYGTIRKDVKDPEGTRIISMKESIERSHEFLDALKKPGTRIQTASCGPYAMHRPNRVNLSPQNTRSLLSGRLRPG